MKLHLEAKEKGRMEAKSIYDEQEVNYEDLQAVLADQCEKLDRADRQLAAIKRKIGNTDTTKYQVN